MIAKPADVFGRGAEWADLAEFATSTLPGLRIAVIYGRRRQGKSYLLRRLAASTGGLYHLATEQTERIGLRRFADALGGWLDLAPGALSFDNWEAALTSTTGLMAARPRPDAAGPLLVLDEFPYLTSQTPGLPSLVQSVYDDVGPGGLAAAQPLRLLLCGSAISVMSELLSGTHALRGRGALELRVQPFDYRDARRFWDIDSVRVAFRHNALIGGTPGYRDMVPDPHVPEDPSRFDDWLARSMLRPTMPLFDEASRVIHEDPRIRQTAVYGSLLAAIAAGESSPTKLGGLLGRPTSALSHQLSMLEATGFIQRHADLLHDRRPTIGITDPIVRLHRLVIEPHLADLEAGRGRQIWGEARHTVESKIFGPHFESLVLAWVARYARAEAGIDAGATGQVTIGCRQHRAGHEIGVLSLVRGARPRIAGTGVAFLGEAKCRDRPAGIDQLRRLEHLRDLLTGTGHDASAATLGIFTATTFADDLVAEAARRDDVLLADLDTLYGEGAA